MILNIMWNFILARSLWIRKHCIHIWFLNISSRDCCCAIFFLQTLHFKGIFYIVLETGSRVFFFFFLSLLPSRTTNACQKILAHNLPQLIPKVLDAFEVGNETATNFLTLETDQCFVFKRKFSFQKCHCLHYWCCHGSWIWATSVSCCFVFAHPVLSLLALLVAFVSVSTFCCYGLSHHS